MGVILLIEKIEISCIEEYERLIMQNTCPKDTKTFYRGISNNEWEINEPSIYRDEYLKNEHEVYEKVTEKYSRLFHEDMSIIERLEIFQHYGIPTRLLDVTEDHLVALYFACKDYDTKDGCINSYTIGFEDIKEYKDSDAKKIAEIATLKNINIGNLNNKVYCIENKNFGNNIRMKAQKGAFLLFGSKSSTNKNNKIVFSEKDDPYIKRKEYMVCSSSKKNILKELKFIGIEEETLFPKLKEYYLSEFEK